MNDDNNNKIDDNSFEVWIVVYIVRSEKESQTTEEL